MATRTLPSPDVSGAVAARSPGVWEKFSSRLSSGQPAAWSWKTLGGLAALIVIWAAWMHGTWETWGWLTADCGREMYVPTVLSEGKTLYKDIWYLYGPLAPYWNSFLFRIFGVHLEVLYWAGSLSAMGSAILIYLSGMRMSSPLAGWTAGAVVLTQSFQHSLFSFPLPYSFASVYGCLTACMFLWLVIHGADSSRTAWVFGAGTAAAVALLLKIEIGAACYVGLAMLIAARWYRGRSWKAAAKDIAVCLPGIAVCGVVLFWMISLGGVKFLTQENIMSWPSSFFMRTYGKYWLASTGLSLSLPAFAKTVERTMFLLGIFQGFHLLMTWRRTARRIIFLRLALFLGALLYLVTYLRAIEALRYSPLAMTLQEVMRYLFFPQDMVLYIGIASAFAWLHFWKEPNASRSAAVALVLSFSAMLAARILLMTTPWGYAIFYDVPAVLSLLLLARQLVCKEGGSHRFSLAAEAAICLLCLTATLVNTKRQGETPFPPTARLTTERGNIRVSDHFAEQYQAAIQFMKVKSALGEQVLSIPEDTSLYFLSATHCPTRVFAFTPGVLSPGKMTDEIIQQIEKKQVHYLIWSNRTYSEYQAPRFGVDFDQPLANYLQSHYHRERILVENPVPLGEWNAYVWERNSETKSP